MDDPRRFDRVADAEAWGADICLECRGCGRRVTFDLATFRAILQDKRIDDERGRVERRLRCRRCYRRGGRLRLVPAGDPGALRLEEGDPLPLKGISITDWCAARGDRERRRLIRQARD